MNTPRERMISKHSYIQRQVRSMQPHNTGVTATLGRAAEESTRFASDLGRQVFLFAGLFLLVAVILEATTGNTLFYRLISWTGLFSE